MPNIYFYIFVSGKLFHVTYLSIEIIIANAKKYVNLDSFNFLMHCLYTYFPTQKTEDYYLLMMNMLVNGISNCPLLQYKFRIMLALKNNVLVYFLSPCEMFAAIYYAYRFNRVTIYMYVYIYIYIRDANGGWDNAYLFY